MTGGTVTREEGMALAGLQPHDILELFSAAGRITRHFLGSSVDLCAIVNAKSGACSEDCSYCAQSARSRAGTAVYPLLDEDAILEKATYARDNSVRRFCIVTSGRRVSRSELARIGRVIEKIRLLGLLPCATLGLLEEDDLRLLRDSGLERYHHNLESSESHFSRVCTTHSYADKIRTIEAVKAAGLSLCSGGIFGMGETWQDRVEMAFLLGDLGADSIPINFLTPVKGTPLEGMEPLHPLDALKIISVYRYIHPRREIRVCGGRLQTLGELNPLLFVAGASGLLVGNYLTTLGRDMGHDVTLIRMMGLSVKSAAEGDGLCAPTA